MYGRIRHCDDFPFLALCDFRVIFRAIFRYFCLLLVRLILGHFSLDFFEGIMGKFLVPLYG
jgi:hypothetical protein